MVSLLGHRGGFGQPQQTRRRGAQALVRAFHDRPGTRVVAVASAGVLPEPDGSLRGEVDLAERYRTIFEDQRAMYQTLATSPLDWVLLCPPNVPSGPVTGRAVRAAETWSAGGGPSITTGELARLTLDLALVTEPRCTRVGVAESSDSPRSSPGPGDRQS